MSKKVVFGCVLFLFVAVIIAIPVYYVSTRYTISVIPRMHKSEFSLMLRSSRVKSSRHRDDMASRDMSDLRARRLQVKRPHPYSGFRTQPLVKGTMRYGSMGQQSFEIDNLGFRSPTLKEKTPGTFRVAMVGGSSVWLGSRNENTIVAKLAKRIHSLGRRAEYINAGIVAGVAGQELSVLVHDLLDLDVDLLISFDGFNDIYWPTASSKYRIGFPQPLGRRCASFYPPRQQTNGDGRMRTSRAFFSYLNTIRKMAKTSEAFGIQYLAVLQPSLPYLKYKHMMMGSSFQDPGIAFYEKTVEHFEAANQEHKHGAHYISATDWLSKDHFWDQVHFSAEANEIVAKRLFDYIVSNMNISFN